MFKFDNTNQSMDDNICHLLLSNNPPIRVGACKNLLNFHFYMDELDELSDSIPSAKTHQSSKTHNSNKFIGLSTQQLSTFIPASDSGEITLIKTNFFQKSRMFLFKHYNRISCICWSFGIIQIILVVLSIIAFLMGLVFKTPIEVIYSQKIAKYFANSNVQPIYDSISYTSQPSDIKACGLKEELIPYKDYSKPSDFKFQIFNAMYDLKYMSSLIYFNKTIEQAAHTYIRKKCQNKTQYQQIVSNFLTSIAKYQLKQLKKCQNYPFNLYQHQLYQQLTYKQQQLIYKNISKETLYLHGLILNDDQYNIQFVSQELPFYCHITTEQIFKLIVICILWITVIYVIFKFRQIVNESNSISKQIYHDMINLKNENLCTEVSCRTDIIKKQHLDQYAHNSFIHKLLWRLILINLNVKYFIKESHDNRGQDILIIY